MTGRHRRSGKITTAVKTLIVLTALLFLIFVPAWIVLGMR